MSCHHSQTSGAQKRIHVRLVPNVGSHRIKMKNSTVHHATLGSVRWACLHGTFPAAINWSRKHNDITPPPYAATLRQLPDALHTQHICFSHQLLQLSLSNHPPPTYASLPQAHLSCPYIHVAVAVAVFHCICPSPILRAPCEFCRIFGAPWPLWTLLYASSGQCVFAASL